MKDSEKELNYLLDKIRFEIDENGGSKRNKNGKLQFLV